jgi:acetate---CoA ligase (ADP-forming)
VVIHVNMTVIMGFRHVDMLGNIIQAALRVREEHGPGMHIVLVLRSDGDLETEERKREYRQRATANGVAVFDELAQAARGLAAVRIVEAYRSGGGV